MASKRADITKYVSNTGKDIYGVSGLPEEVVAVIFAYVSRSPLSFRENIKKVLEEEEHGRERASKFHEKWVLNYGHASVAEHASVHLGVEKVSRLFSSVLELCGEHLSFTEYSQRYQRPRRGDFVVPPEIEKDARAKKRFSSLCELQYDAYEELNEKLLPHLKKNNKGGLSESALEKIAFEDARYALGLAYTTNLGMTANARAVEDCVSKLLSSPYAEAGRRGEEMKKEARFSVPTLVKYADENPHITSVRATAKRFARSARRGGRAGPHVRLVSGGGKEADALRLVCSALLYENGGDASLTSVKYKKLFGEMIKSLGKHDNPPDALKLVTYRAEFTISEACWHQLLRHRKVDWFPQDPSVGCGVTVPPNITAARADEVLLRAVRESEKVFLELEGGGQPLAAHYAVTNAHNRRVIGSFSLWELYHLVNIRMSEGAQWDVKQTVRMLAEKIRKRHPALTTPALRRVS